jgi:hypothetical protein
VRKLRYTFLTDPNILNPLKETGPFENRPCPGVMKTQKGPSD